MASEHEKLQLYREKVLEELRARAERLREIDGALASNKYLLESHSASQPLRSGNTLRALTGASRQATLRREHKELERKRISAAEDLRRAEQRLAEVEQELVELGDNGDTTEKPEGEGEE